MSALAVAAVVVGVLLVGGYGIAALDRAMAPGTRRRGRSLLMPLHEASGLLRQEALTPQGADRFLFWSAPFLALGVVALAALVIPAGPGLVGIHSSVGLFYFIIILGPVVIALMNAGWSQNSRPGLLGSFRAATHLLSYEVPLGFAALGPVMHAGSLSTMRIVEGQSFLWYAAWQPLGLAIFLISALFMTYRRPFDLPHAGSELGGGVFAEYSGPRLLLFKVALNALFLLLMAMGVTLFFGGWRGPWLPGPVWLALKTLALAAAVLWGSRRLPRLRQDQMLAISWKVLLPASLVNVLWVGVFTFIIPGGA